MAQPVTFEAVAQALALSTQQQARIKQLEAVSADARTMAEATRAGILALERACSMAHALALAEMASTDPTAQAQAAALFPAVQEVLREAKELAARVS